MIECGDVVQVVRWPCCRARLGWVFVVDRIVDIPTYAYCDYCDAEHRNTGRGVAPETGSGYYHQHALVPIAWVRKFIPPADDEAIDTERETEMVT